MKTMNRILIIFSLFYLVSCNQADPPKTVNQDSLRKEEQKRQAIRDSIEKDRIAKELAYKSSPEYKKKESEANKIINKFKKIISSAYNGYDRTFNMNKYVVSMEKYGFTPGKYTGDYKGIYKGHNISIRKLAATSSSSGWVQHFVITCDDFDGSLDL